MITASLLSHDVGTPPRLWFAGTLCLIVLTVAASFLLDAPARRAAVDAEAVAMASR